MSYTEDEYLLLSGIQHFSFCRRQWALIHVENLWAENIRTTEGQLLHEKAHDSSLKEKHGDLFIMRGAQISSRELGVSGQCDVLEFHRDPKGITLPEIEGRWRPYPVEYKRGAPKTTTEDKLQLCGQALCLEEMLCCEIQRGALFYGENRRREEIEFTDELRKMVRSTLLEMHQMYRKGKTPKAKPSKSCKSCSLKDLCLPRLIKTSSVDKYLRKAMEENE